MRTTITLDPDVQNLIQRAMRERRLTFKQAVNQAIRDSLGPRSDEPFRTETFHMGPPKVPLDKALQLAGELEDAELIRRYASGE